MKLAIGSTTLYNNIDNVCKDDDCPICSGIFASLPPIEKKKALARMKHSPHIFQFKYRKRKYPPLSADELQQIKDKYQHPKIIRREELDWDDYAKPDELKQLDQKINEYNASQKIIKEYNERRNQPTARGGMTIDVGEQADNDMNNDDLDNTHCNDINCPVCSGTYARLSSIEQKKALARMKHPVNRNMIAELDA